MSHDDMEAVQAIYDGFRQGDIDAIVSRYDPECEILAPEGQLSGHAGARAFWEPRARGTDLSAEVGEPEDLGEGRVLARVRLTFATPQGDMTVTSWNVWTLNDDHKVTRWQFFTSRDQAREAARGAT
jgi:limonene-1,2-epoxide hydrolase